MQEWATCNVASQQLYKESIYQLNEGEGVRVNADLSKNDKTPRNFNPYFDNSSVGRAREEEEEEKEI